MTTSLAVILGGAAGAVGLVALLVFLWFCLLHKRSVSRTSETGSSDPSLQAEQGIELSLLRGGPHPSDSREARRFMLDELNLATKNFSDINLIGQGKFGEVYKGLLNDGMIVAIKRRPGAPNQELIEEVRYLSSIRHRNIVILLGYCQENNQQMLVYEYIPNGSVSSHLYAQISNELLEFKNRLSVALGAAKGLEHLHALNPPLLHKDFNTRNVLVDENFVAKVADAGLTNLLGRIDAAGPSSRIVADDVFLDPEFIEFGRFSNKSNVYSFGVFLLELVSGQEALKSRFSESNQSMVEWVQNYQDTSDIAAIIDPRLSTSFTDESMKELIWLMAHCVNPSSERRPAMNYVVSELDRILEKEMNLTMIMGEGTPIVTLGSQLFTASR
ncbi:probable serine/threonine-protein kinase PBL21 isoform X2 [Magnolia sinica]|uniref:probable serine/threonine-protein kinase PBL21 isoform X2 n=1 Tax=Magnolia sinica TaxID=86752 RepID=UPI00265B67E4|nr:probable serine/threonine-protein kinase PBL21 isoform X2 [Magnolia sinica]